MHKDQITRAALHLNLCLIVFVTLSSLPVSAASKSITGNPLPAFTTFVEQVQNGETDVLRGVYVPEILALPVSQQPAGQPHYVSSNDGEATQFSTASEYGNIGLLAHNHLSGDSFLQLAEGQEVRLVYGDGKVEYFIVTEILRFQALQPKSAWSQFRDVTDDEVLSAGQMFDRVYSGGRHVTFQTCIRVNGNWNWGRLFVLAMPLHSYVFHAGTH